MLWCQKVPFDSAGNVLASQHDSWDTSPEGSIEDATESWYGPEGHHQSASLWWPEDRAWFISTEVDLYSTYIGGSRSCIDAIVAEPRIEGSEADIHDGITWASDRINPNPHLS